MNDLKLPSKTKTILQDFVSGTKDIYKEGLVSVILYGSAASGEFSSAHSNINLAIILSNASLSNVAKIAPLLKKNKFRLLKPVFFTEGYILTSADVFPVEFLDMKENHKILYGKDVLAGLEIDIKNLRFQCEQELKSKIINIKRAYLDHLDSPGLDKILMNFFTSSLHILRNVLRLKKGHVAYRKEDILAEAAGAFHIDISTMKKILDAKIANKRLSKKEAAGLFISFVDDLEKFSNVVDAL